MKLGSVMAKMAVESVVYESVIGRDMYGNPEAGITVGVENVRVEDNVKGVTITKDGKEITFDKTVYFFEGHSRGIGRELILLSDGYIFIGERKYTIVNVFEAKDIFGGTVSHYEISIKSTG